MGATGESARRLTDFCYLPAWSPDGKEIACSTVSPYRPDVRESSSSQILVIDMESGKQRMVSGGALDAVQPSWSPDGRHIAFWGVREGARDIFSVAREGGEVSSITNDEALDWNPVWSPDGKHLYFSSDRGGAMNLWRVAVAAASGKRIGDPEPVNVPSSYAASISFSGDGQRLAYANWQRSSNIYRVAFDPQRESVAGAPQAVTQGVKETLYPSISRDGAWIAFTLLGSQEDLAVVRADGSDLRRITEDPARDRGPRWSPAGGEIAFTSTRSGRFEIWTIHPDGSGLRQVTEDSPRGGVWYPAWSPDGRRLSYNLPDEMGFIVEVGKPWREQQPRVARAELPGHSWLWLNDWSHDGGKIAGTLQKLDGGSLGIGAFNLETKKFEQYTSFGQLPRWLPDGRKLLFHARGRIFLSDPAGKSTKEILSAKDGTINPYFDVSWDGRMIAFSLESIESDIWIMTAGR
jgi:Tol biopolymer transport system component